jgi:hypothetical protein
VVVGAGEVGDDVTWYSHYGKQFGDFSQSLSTVVPCDPVISLLVINQTELKIVNLIFFKLFFTVLEIESRTSLTLGKVLYH